MNVILLYYEMTDKLSWNCKLNVVLTVVESDVFFYLCVLFTFVEITIISVIQFRA